MYRIAPHHFLIGLLEWQLTKKNCQWMKPLTIQEASQCGTVHDASDAHPSSKDGNGDTILFCQTPNIAKYNLKLLLKSWSSDRGWRESQHQQRLQDILQVAIKDKITDGTTAVTGVGSPSGNSLTEDFVFHNASINITHKLQRWLMVLCLGLDSILIRKQKKKLPLSSTNMTKLGMFQCLQHQHAKVYSMI